jgi:endoglycosylceramidase
VRLSALALSVVALSALTGSASAADLPWVHAVRGADARFVDEHGRQVLYQGVNVAELNEYATFNEHPPDAPPLTRDDLRAMRRLGFNAIRLLIAWSRLEPQPGRIDQAYLAEVEQAVRWAADEGIYSIVDMHQDAYSVHTKAPEGQACPPGTEPSRGWDGAPKWATIDDGLLRCATGGVRDLAPAVVQAFENLWADRPAADGVGIQTRLVAAWRAVAERLAGKPNVAGYDLLNEPHPGWQATGADPATIGRFFTRAIEAIRTVDRRHTIFVEPSVLRSAVSDAIVVAPVTPPDENLGYAPHVYGDLAFGEGQQREYDNMRREAATAGGSGGALPIWLGEFPMLDGDQDRYNRSTFALLDANLIGWAHWVWKETCGNPHTGYGPVPPSTVVAYDCEHDRFTEVKPNRRPFLNRPHPIYAPGRLTAMSFDPDSKRFSLSATAADPKRTAPLELLVPVATHYGGRLDAVAIETSGLGGVELRSRGDGNAVLTARAAAADWSVTLTRRAPGAGGTRTPAGARPRLRLTVTPRRVRAGRVATFRFRATAGSKPVGGVRIRLAKKIAISDRAGRATIRTRFGHAARYHPKASRRGYVSARRHVRVVG